jgi:glutathione S-transferase
MRKLRTMKIELVSSALCPYVHRAAVMLREKGVSYDRKIVDLKNKPEWFLKISPRGKVPVLVVDGVALFESAAINEYLDETHPPRMLADDPMKRAIERAWVEVANDVQKAQYDVFAAPSAEARAQIKLDPILARIEEGIGPVIDPDGFGLLHVTFAPSLYRFVIMERSARFLDGYPKLSALAHRVADRPSVKEAVPSDYTDLFLDSLRRRGSALV